MKNIQVTFCFLLVSLFSIASVHAHDPSEHKTKREKPKCEAMKNMVSQNRLEQYELDYFDGLKDEEIPWGMLGPQFMMKNRRDACAAKGIDLSQLKDNELYGFPTEFRFFPNQIFRFNFS
mgnify:CR=1 FL=1